MASPEEFLARLRATAERPEPEESLEERGDRLRPDIRRLQIETMRQEELKAAREEQEAAADPLDIAAETITRAQGRIGSIPRAVGQSMRDLSAVLGKKYTTQEESQEAYEQGIERLGGARRLAQVSISPEERQRIMEQTPGEGLASRRQMMIEEAENRERARLLRGVATAAQPTGLGETGEEIAEDVGREGTALALSMILRGLPVPAALGSAQQAKVAGRILTSAERSALALEKAKHLGLLGTILTQPEVAPYMPFFYPIEAGIGAIAGGMRGAREEGPLGILPGAVRGAVGRPLGMRHEQELARQAEEAVGTPEEAEAARRAEESGYRIAQGLPKSMSPEEREAWGQAGEMGLMMGIGGLQGRMGRPRLPTGSDLVRDLEIRAQQLQPPRPGREAPVSPPARQTIGETAQRTLEKLAQRAQQAEPGSAPKATAMEMLRRIEQGKAERTPFQGFGPDTVGAARAGESISPEERIQKIRDKEASFKAQIARGETPTDKNGFPLTPMQQQKKLVAWAKERAKIQDEAQRSVASQTAAPEKAAEPAGPEIARSDQEILEEVLVQRARWRKNEERLADERARRELEERPEEPPARTAEETLADLREDYRKSVEYTKDTQADAARGRATQSEVDEALAIEGAYQRRLQETAAEAVTRTATSEPPVSPPAPTPQEPFTPSAEPILQEAPRKALSPSDIAEMKKDIIYWRTKLNAMSPWQADPTEYKAVQKRLASLEEMLASSGDVYANRALRAKYQDWLRSREMTPRQERELLEQPTVEEPVWPPPPPTPRGAEAPIREPLPVEAPPEAPKMGRGGPEGERTAAEWGLLAEMRDRQRREAMREAQAPPEPEPMPLEEIRRRFGEEEEARRAEIERQAVPAPPKRPVPSAPPPPPPAPPGFGQGGKKRAKGAPPVVEPPDTVAENGRTAGENDAQKMADLEDQAVAPAKQKAVSTPAAPPGSPLGPPAFKGPPVAQPGTLANHMKAPEMDFRFQKQSDLNLRMLMPDVAPELYVRMSWETEQAFRQEQKLLATVKDVVGKLSPSEKRDISVLLDSIAVKDAAELNRVVTQPVAAGRTTYERQLAAAGANMKKAFKVIRSTEFDLFDQMVRAGEIPAGVEKPAYFPHVGGEEFWREVVKVDPDYYRSLDVGDRGGYINEAIKRFDDLSPETKKMWLRSSNPNAPGIPAAQSRAAFINDLNKMLNEVDPIRPRVDRWNTPMDEVFFRHALKRSGGSWYKLDLEPVLESYFTMATRRAIQGPTIREFYALSQTPEWQRVPNIVKYVSNQLNQWVGAPAFPDTVLNQMGGIRGLVTSMPVHRAASQLRGLVSAGNLWLNPLSAVKQLLDLARFPEVVGGKIRDMMKAVIPATKDVWAAIWDPNSPQRAEIVRNNLTNAKSITALTEDFHGKMWNALNRVGYSMIRTADTMVRVSTYFTAKRLAERVWRSPRPEPATLEQIHQHGTPEHWARAVANEVAGTLVRGLSPQSQHTTLGKLTWHFAYIPGKQIGSTLRAAFGKKRGTAGPGLLNRARGNIGAPYLSLSETAKAGALATTVARIMTLAGLVALGYSKQRATTIAVGGTPAAPLSMLTGSQSPTDVQPIALSPEMQAIVNGIRYLTADTEDEREDAARDLQRTGVGFIPGGRVAQKLGDVAIDVSGKDSPIPFLRTDRKKSGVSLTESGGQVRPQTTRKSLTDIIAGRLFSRETEPEAQMRYSREDMRAMGEEKADLMAEARQMARTGDIRGAAKMIVTWHKKHPGGDPGRDIGSIVNEIATPQGTSFGRSAGTAPPEARRAFVPRAFSNPKAQRFAKMASLSDSETVRRILLQKAEAEERGVAR